VIHLRHRIVRRGYVYTKGSDDPADWLVEGWVFKSSPWQGWLARKFPSRFACAGIYVETATGRTWLGGYTPEALRRRSR
jgi:hypothetical protein